MDAGKGSAETATKRRTAMERKSDRELVVSRTIDGPARLVFEAWTKPELFQRWWVPKSFGLILVSCEMDIRAGGTYRLVFRHGDSEPMAFFGTYREVTPYSRIVWTNDESELGQTITSVTFEEKGGKTLVMMHELYASKEALDSELGSQAKDCMDETFEQLEELLAGMERR